MDNFFKKNAKYTTFCVYIKSLKEDLVIYVGFIAVDSSMNKSEEKIDEFTSLIMEV